MNYQIDLNIKSTENIEQYLGAIEELGLGSIGISNKSAEIDNLKIIEAILNINPELLVMPHYAVVHHYADSISELKQNFLNYLEKARSLSIKEVLLVSGEPKNSLTSIELLQSLVPEEVEGFEISVVYNPSLENLEEENLRLKVKLETGLVRKVYFQIGEDLQKIKKGIEFVRLSNPNIEIFSCLLIPNPELLEFFKTRSWRGVFLSSDYINSFEYAQKITKEVHNLLVQEGVGIYLDIYPLSYNNLMEIRKYVAD